MQEHVSNFKDKYSQVVFHCFIFFSIQRYLFEYLTHGCYVKSRKKYFSASYKASVGTGISYMVFFFLLKLYFILSLFVFTLSALQQPKTYIYVLLLLCMRPKYFHTSNQGCIYTSLIYFTSSQEHKYRSSSSDFL